MDKYIIQGGERLYGKVRLQSAKNAVLPLLAGCVLTDEPIKIKDVPAIADVENMLRILGEVGCKITRRNEYTLIDSSNAVSHEIPPRLTKELRSSVFMLGSILTRFRKAKISYPGGCDIGLRPIDLHLSGLRRLGVEIVEEGGYIECRADTLKGAEILLDFPSVGATENIILAAVTAQGKTRICGAAREPEVEHLCRYLLACGADIEGVGTDCLCITGGNVLRGTQYTVPADRIVAGTYLFACLAAGGNILLEEAPTEQMASVIELASSMGAECQKAQNGLYVQAPERLRGVRELITLPYPDFPTDLQSVALTAMTAADGECLIEETIFENRFRVVEPLQEMGADIRKLDAARVIVKGPVRLKGCKVEAVELRGGAALVVAGLIAEGETVIRGCRYIGRGYENICRDLRELGARIYSV